MSYKNLEHQLNECCTLALSFWKITEEERNAHFIMNMLVVIVCYVLLKIFNGTWGRHHPPFAFKGKKKKKNMLCILLSSRAKLCQGMGEYRVSKYQNV